MGLSEDDRTDKMKRPALGNFIIMLVILGLVAGGCATTPYTGRRQLLLISEGQELNLGYQAFGEVRQKYQLSRDPVLTAMVKRVGERIARAANRPDYRWEFLLFQDDKQVNAFCLPGGKVGVFTGILKYTQDEAGLATVIAHEAAHAILRHAGERLSQSLLAQVGSAGLGLALSGKSPYMANTIQQLYGIGATVGFILPYSRKQEYEADEVGLILMAKAGYDPEAALGFWQRMMAGPRTGGRMPEFLATHPSDANRLENLRRLLPRIKAQYYNPGANRL